MNRQEGIQQIQIEIQKIQNTLEQNLDTLNKEEIRVLLHKIEKLCEDYKLKYDIEEIKNLIISIRNIMITKSEQINSNFDYTKQSVENDITSINTLNENLNQHLVNGIMYNYEEIITKKVIEQIQNLNKQNYFYIRDMIEIQKLLNKMIQIEAEEYKSEINGYFNIAKINIEDVKNNILNSCPELKQEMNYSEQLQNQRNMDFS